MSKLLRGEAGLTLVEIIVACTVLTVGLLALLHTAALTSRMINEAALATEVSAVAREHLEALLDNGGDKTIDRLRVSWTATSGATEWIAVRVRAPTPQGTRVDSFSTALACLP
jgi:type II secretory pathway pseudopilin PulG